MPAFADALWARVHVVEGRCIRASTTLVAHFGEAFDRLGLAEVARAGIERFKDAAAPPGSVELRYHAVALFDHLGHLLKALSALVREHFEVDAFDQPEAPLSSATLAEAVGRVAPGLAAALERRRPALLRIERLAQEAARPIALRFASPDVAAIVPAADPAEAEVSELGVAPGESPRREWLSVPELAAAMVADAALLIDDVARAALERLEGGARVELDLRIETDQDAAPDRQA